MEVAVENLSKLRRSLKIVLPKERVALKIEAAYKKLKSEVNIKGFRKGKVPHKVLEKSYGEQVNNEVSEQLIQDSYFDALSETNLEAVVHPDVKTFDFNDDGTFAYEAEVEIKPEFELCEYKGLEVEHPEIAIGEEEIQSSLEATRKEIAPLKNVEDRTIEKNDMVIIDFQGYENGEPIKAVSGAEYPLDVGSGRNGEEFEDMVIGLSKGEEATREIDFPPNVPNPVLAGKKIEFKITIKDVKERILPEFDDDFAKDVNEEFKTLDDLKSSISDKIRSEKETAMEGDISDKIMLKLLEGNDFELPARLVAYEINELVKDFENNLERQGMNLESAGMNQEQLAEHYKETAEKRVKGEFILKKIAEVEEIKLADEDIEQGYERISQQYNMSVDEVKGYFKGRNDLLPFMNELLSEKIIRFLRKETKIIFVEPSQEENKEDDKNDTPEAGE